MRVYMLTCKSVLWLVLGRHGVVGVLLLLLLLSQELGQAVLHLIQHLCQGVWDVEALAGVGVGCWSSCVLLPQLQDGLVICGRGVLELPRPGDTARAAR